MQPARTTAAEPLQRPNRPAALTTEAQPDLQGWTIWETIAHTVEADDLIVYLVIDGAHRGFNTKTHRDKATLVSKLVIVNGHSGYPKIPIEWGISTTIERFKEAMHAADAEKDRRALPPITVDGFRVQEPGLIKDTVILEIRAEAGSFDTVLARRAAKKLRSSTERWASNAARRGRWTSCEPSS